MPNFSEYALPYPEGTRMVVLLVEVLIPDTIEPGSKAESEAAIAAFDAGECVVNDIRDGKSFFAE